MPQLGLELGYQLSCHWRAYIGYDLLYWGIVAKAADQIDLNLDPRNFPPSTQRGLPFPQFPGKTDSFWAQGVPSRFRAAVLSEFVHSVPSAFGER